MLWSVDDEAQVWCESESNMIEEIRRFWSALLRGAKLRPPQGHMQMLRDVVRDREVQTSADDAATEKRQAKEQADKRDAKV